MPDPLLTIRVDHYVYPTGESDLAAILRKLDGLAQLIRQEGATIMATLDQVLATVTEETTIIESIGALIQGLKDQIANAGLTAADQAKVDQIFATAEANKAALATAVVANTPAAPLG